MQNFKQFLVALILLATSVPLLAQSKPNFPKGTDGYDMQLHPGVRSTTQGPNGEYYFVGLNDFTKDPQGKTKMMIARVDANGRLAWKKSYHLIGYHTTEGHGVTFLPNGDMLAKAAVFKNFNSSGSLWFAGVSTDGKQLWDFRPDAKFLGANGSVDVTSEGNVRLSGFAYRDRKDFDDSNHAGWIYEFDPDNPRFAKTNKTYTNFRNLRFVKVIDLPNGRTVGVGGIRESDGNRQPVLCTFDQNMNITSTQRLDIGSTKYTPIKATWDANQQEITIHGFEFGDRGKKGICGKFSSDGRIIGAESQPCYH